MANEIAKRPPFSVAIQSDTYKKLINQTLGDPDRAGRFIASISSAVATNPTLKECEAGTILSGALLGESLNLSPSPVLGNYYLVPFNNTSRGVKEAQFQLGYKGYIQLAIRSGQYKRLNVVEVKEGEFKSYNSFTEELVVEPIEDELKRESAKTVGYYAMFTLNNGFTKTMYWSKEKMERHANTYSKGYKARKGFTFWEKDFDTMAKKTMLRQLLSKWGIMTIDMQNAYEKDMAVVHTDGDCEYVDNLETFQDVKEAIEESKKVNLDEI